MEKAWGGMAPNMGKVTGAGKYEECSGGRGWYSLGGGTHLN